MGWEVEGRFKREGPCVCLWLIHVDVWQKPTQYCKAIIHQLKIKKFLKKCPGEGNGNPLQYSHLENLIDRGAWKATVHKESDMTEWLSTHTWNDPAMFPFLSHFIPNLHLSVCFWRVQPLDRDLNSLTTELFICHTKLMNILFPTANQKDHFQFHKCAQLFMLFHSTSYILNFSQIKIFEK